MSGTDDDAPRHRRWVDLGEIAVVTAMLGFLLWHLFVTYQASSRVTNLLMVVPGTGLFVILWAAIVWSKGILGAGVPRPDRGAVGWKIPVLMLAFGLYIAALPVIGIDVGTAVFTAACLVILGERNLLRAGLYSVGLGALIGALMARGLSVGAPALLF